MFALEKGIACMNSVTNAPWNSDQWYLVHCKPRKELYAARVLRNLLGLTIFLPEISTCLRGKLQRVPFFPGYFFVLTNLQKVHPSLINSSPGVLRLLEFGGRPQSVPPAVIKTISEQVNRLNCSGSLPNHSFYPDDRVRIKSSPPQGLETLFVGPTTPSMRVHLLLHLLDCSEEISMHVDALEKILSAPDAKRERRTRGKGRKINNNIHSSQTMRISSQE